MRRITLLLLVLFCLRCSPRDKCENVHLWVPHGLLHVSDPLTIKGKLYGGVVKVDSSFSSINDLVTIKFNYSDISSNARFYVSKTGMIGGYSIRVIDDNKSKSFLNCIDTVRAIADNQMPTLSVNQMLDSLTAKETIDTVMATIKKNVIPKK